MAVEWALAGVLDYLAVVDFEIGMTFEIAIVERIEAFEMDAGTENEFFVCDEDGTLTAICELV